MLHTLLSQGYAVNSFDVIFLFTNVSWHRTIKIIFKRIYGEKLVNTTWKKRTMKKLITDICKKTAFGFNNNLYKKADGIAMVPP